MLLNLGGDSAEKIMETLANGLFVIGVEAQLATVNAIEIDLNSA